VEFQVLEPSELPSVIGRSDRDGGAPVMSITTDIGF
jgi:hypothetical protein